MSIRPIIKLDRGFTSWGEQQIYTGPTGTGQECPNVDDKVWSWTHGPMRCISLNVDTGISIIEPWIPPTNNVDSNGLDILLANGGHSPEEYYMLHVDNSVRPATITPDAKLRMYRKDADHVKYVIGYYDESTEEIISKQYDGAGNYINDRVNLEILQADEPNTVTVVTPVRSHTTHTLLQGQIVTAMTFNEQGGLISTTKMIVNITALFEKGLNSARYITGIELKSSWMRVDSNVLDIPINLPVSSMGLMGEVTYNNGERIQHPIDGTRFSLYGLDNYVASVPDYNHTLVLSYQFDANEVSTTQSSTDSKHETKAYTIHTLPAKHEYNLKLYVYPHWDGNGWILRYYLANLSRSEIVEVTSLVEYGTSNTSSFNPTLWGIEQTFTASIRLDEVDASFSAYRHVQSFKVVLFGIPKISNNASWMVHYQDGGDNAYGETLHAAQRLVTVNDYAFTLGSGQDTRDGWLALAYRNIVPLYDKAIETSAPNPTHFDVVIGTERKRYDIAMWDEQLNFGTKLYTGALLPVIWIMETEHKDLHLGMSGLMVKAV
jgi:hypothetical protein